VARLILCGMIYCRITVSQQEHNVEYYQALVNFMEASKINKVILQKQVFTISFIA